MPSPSVASENVVVYCARLHGALSVSLYVKHQTRPPPPGHVSCSMCFTRYSQVLQCTGQRSIKVTRPCMQRVGLQPARYIEAAAYRTISRYRDMKRHDISISLLGYDMITMYVYMYAVVRPTKIECLPMPNVMAALPNIGGALCSMPQSLADAHDAAKRETR